MPKIKLRERERERERADSYNAEYVSGVVTVYGYGRASFLSINSDFGQFIDQMLKKLLHGMYVLVPYTSFLSVDA